MLDPPLGPSVDDLVNALSNQPSTDASAPTDVSLDGYSGKYVDYRMTGPDSECAFSEIRRWPSGSGPRLAIQDERDQVWVLDVDGIRLVVDAFSFSGTPSDALDEVRRVVESIRIDPLP